MTEENLKRHKLGWIGTGRMGYPLAKRLLKANCDVAIYNRTRAKAEPLTELGAQIVDSPPDLADRDIVFTILAASSDFVEVTTGAKGLLSHKGRAPKILIDCSTVSVESSAAVRSAAAKVGTALLAAPVSGNPAVVKAGKLSIVVSGPEETYREALQYLNVLAPGVSYVGDGDVARTVKICHNLLLGVLTQSLAEVTILAEKAGVLRHAFLDFINKSVLGSTFTRYKTPAFVNLDFTPTFTPHLLRKDFDLGLAAGRELDVPLPVSALVREMIQNMINNGYTDCDFAALLKLQADASNHELKPENVHISDGLETAEDEEGDPFT